MILVDVGPLVALVDADDRYHARCVAALARTTQAVGTVWPVVAEALRRLEGVASGPETVLEMLARGAPRLLPFDGADVPRLCELRRIMRSARRMEIAHAALLRCAEREGLDTFFTLDARLATYRLGGRRRVRTVPLPSGGSPARSAAGEGSRRA